MSSISAGTTSTTTLVHSGDTTGSLVFKTNDTGSGGTTAVTIDTSQNVGIGTTSPSYKFQVSGSGLGLGLAVTDTSATSGVGQKITNTTNTLNFGINNSAGNAFNGGGAYGAVFDATGAYAMAFCTNSSERMRIDSSGNVGINTTNPDYGSYGATEKILGITGVAGNRGRLSLQNTSTGTSGVAGTIAFFNGSTLLASLDVDADGATNKGLYAFNTNNGTSVSERMRIDSSGNLLVGTTSGTGYCRMNLSTDSGTNKWDVGPRLAAPTNFYILQNQANGVYIASGANSWTAFSDERLKTDLKPIEDAVNKVSKLRSVTGRFKTDDVGISRSFLIAQDVDKVLPEAVDKSDSERWGVAYTDLIPLLVASIKEQQALITAQAETINALTARVVALESKA